MKRAWAVLLACAALPAEAHQQSVSLGEVDMRGERVSARLRFAGADLAAILRLEQGPDGQFTQRGVDAVLPALLHLTLDEYAVSTPDGACRLDPGGSAEVEGGDGIVVQGSWTCPREVEALRVRAGFLEVLQAGHAHVAKVSFADGQVSQRMVQADSPRFEIERRSGFWAAAGRFLRLGIEHIFTGYDHIAFLIGLLLLGGSFKELVQIVTAFTVAHSITLALATLAVVNPTPRVIEPLIAASIVYVAAENLWALRRGTGASALRHRWMLTFAFGLVHGFGFASVLRELRLPRSGLAAALVTFNLGVEVGQVCIVALAVPLLAALRKTRWFEPLGVRLCSFVVGCLGLTWLVQRIGP
ncbi:MAG: HupE/UreJ family protein [Myxococcales bacterium]